MLFFFSKGVLIVVIHVARDFEPSPVKSFSRFSLLFLGIVLKIDTIFKKEAKIGKNNYDNRRKILRG